MIVNKQSRIVFGNPASMKVLTPMAEDVCLYEADSFVKQVLKKRLIFFYGPLQSVTTGFTAGRLSRGPQPPFARSAGLNISILFFPRFPVLGQVFMLSSTCIFYV